MSEVTQEDVYAAALQWCGEKDRETSLDDTRYFQNNWQHASGFRQRVEAFASHRTQALTTARAEAEAKDAIILQLGENAATAAKEYADNMAALRAEVERVAGADFGEGVMAKPRWTDPRMLNDLDAEFQREAFGSATELHIVFDGPPGPTAGRFVECETPDGHSVRVGTWQERSDGLWALVIPYLPAPPAHDHPQGGESHE